MVDLFNIDGTSLVPNIQPFTSGIADIFQQRRTKQEQEIQRQQLLQSAIRAAAGNTEELARIALFNPQAANAITQALERNDQDELEGARVQAEKSVRNAIAVQSTPFDQRPNEFIRLAQEARQQGDIPGAENILRIANLPEAEQDLELQKIVIQNDDIARVTARATARNEALLGARVPSADIAGGGITTIDPVTRKPVFQKIEGFQLNQDKNKIQFGSQTTVKDEQGNLFFATTKRDPKTGNVVAVLAPLQGDKPPVGAIEQVGTLGQTGQERIQQKGDETRATVAAGGAGKRIEAAINEGVGAAQGVAVLKRAIDLLDLVKTGGIDAALLRGKQLFGIESANEAELSSSLGKAVLSQLRTTFGAQFTEQEGARLERIEAGFGKSTAGNRRLLSLTLQIARRAAQRGIKAAQDAGDLRAAADIQELLDFELSDDDVTSQFTPQPTEQPAAQQPITVDF